MRATWWRGCASGSLLFSSLLFSSLLFSSLLFSSLLYSSLSLAAKGPPLPPSGFALALAPAEASSRSRSLEPHSFIPGPSSSALFPSTPPPDGARRAPASVRHPLPLRASPRVHPRCARERERAWPPRFAFRVSRSHSESGEAPDEPWALLPPEREGEERDRRGFMSPRADSPHAVCAPFSDGIRPASRWSTSLSWPDANVSQPSCRPGTWAAFFWGRNRSCCARAPETPPLASFATSRVSAGGHHGRLRQRGDRPHSREPSELQSRRRSAGVGATADERCIDVGPP